MNTTAIKSLPIPTESDLKRLERYDAAVRTRGLIEMALVRHMVTALVGAGYAITVDDGGDVGDEPVKFETRVEEIVDACFGVDECRLYLYKKGHTRSVGWIFLVFGNDGWDAISDYTVNLEEVLASTNAYADELSQWC